MSSATCSGSVKIFGIRPDRNLDWYRPESGEGFQL
jgi:hypothetical protein